jgi:hypothetical protein
MATKNKTCVSCNQKLSIKMFYKSNITKDGIDYYCKECRKSSTLKSHRGGKRKNPCSIEGCETLTYAKGFCRIHYARWDRHGDTDLLNYKREVYENGQTYTEVRKNHLRRMFKISVDEYSKMSSNGCEICGAMGEKHKILHVDHDHKCCPVEYVNGKSQTYRTCGLCIRGVLCNKCNAAVGRYEKDQMRNDYPLKDKVINYVAKYNQIISDRMVSNGKIKETRGR